MHPASRIARAIQQLRSFAELHGRELDGLADELEAAGLPEQAQRLRVFRGLQNDEASLVVDELEQLRSTLLPQVEEAAPDPRPASASESPKRARWLAEQARPRLRRDVFTRRSSSPSGGTSPD
jgi:hypothetical protein